MVNEYYSNGELFDCIINHPKSDFAKRKLVDRLFQQTNIFELNKEPNKESSSIKNNLLETNDIESIIKKIKETEMERELEEEIFEHSILNKAPSKWGPSIYSDINVPQITLYQMNLF